MDRSKPATAQNAPGQETVERAGGSSGVDDQIVQRAIGTQLRAVYDEVVRLPVPDRFLSLLSSLDSVSGKPEADGGADK